MVILGGIGVWSVARVFVQQRVRSVAILKCLGATSGQVLAIYVLQMVALGLGGSLLGVALAGGALAAIPASLAEQAATAVGLGDVSYGLRASAVAQGVGVGVVVSLLFALGPLLEMRTIKPLALLRWGLVTTPALDWVQIVVVVALTAVLIVLASWQAASVAGRVLAVWGVRPRGGRAAAGGAGAGAGDPAVRRRGAVRAAPRRAQPGATRQPDAGDLAVGRAGQLLHHRDSRGPGEPAQRLRARDSRRDSRYVSHRHPAGPGGWRQRPAHAAGPAGAPFPAGPACAGDRGDRATDQPGHRPCGAAARRRTRVHRHLPGSPRGERTDRDGRVLGARGVRTGRGVGRGECARAVGSGDRRHDPV